MPSQKSTGMTKASRPCFPDKIQELLVIKLYLCKNYEKQCHVDGTLAG